MMRRICAYSMFLIIKWIKSIRGMVAKEPTVPGAIGEKPVPKNDKKRILGFLQLKFCTFVMSRLPLLCL